MRTVIVTEADSNDIHNIYENVTGVSYGAKTVRISYRTGSLQQSITYPYERILRIYEEFET